MKKIIFIFLLVLSFHAKSYGNACMVCPDPSPYVYGCAQAESLGCIGSVEVSSCNECLPGYTLEPGITQCSQTLYTCVEDTGGCTCDCPVDVGWTNSGTGYQVYTEYLCNSTTCACDATYSYRCATGYYGTANFRGNSGCNSCITGTGVSGSISVAGTNSLITDCYLPTTFSGADPTGTYSYSQNCYYSN